MHIEVLVEDQSGKRALDILIPKIVGGSHTFTVHSYKGIGRIPRNMRDSRNASHRILLENLPKLLKGYGRTHSAYPVDYPAAVIVVCDLDEKCLKAFREELFNILEACRPQPTTRFCIAIEEGEAWFLGDVQALRSAYPYMKEEIIREYVQDSICGTWEVMADAVYPGGHAALVAEGWQAVGTQKSIWAERIAPHMKPDENHSTSFCYFRDKLLELAVG